MRSFAAAMFTCAYLMVTGAAYAELTEVDLFLNGDGLVTRDDATGLDWLDLTATTNLSFNDILAGADGWVGAGWRHATGQEVCSLFNSIEDLFNCSPPLGRQAAAGTFELWQGPQALFGVTQDEADRDRSLGIYDQEDEGESDRVGRGAIAIFPVAETVQSEILTDQFFETTSSSLVGHWLVRLPEPSPNLLLNSHFDQDLSSWTPEGLLTADWDPMDVDGSALSGSALLRNIASGAGFVRGLQQCVEVTPGASYDVGGWVYVAEAQATAGVAFVDLSWRMDPDCSGFISAGPDSPHVSTEGQWVFTEARDVTAPANAQGASIRLTTQKLDAGGEFAAFFDDASIVPAPEPSATLLSGAALIALVALAGLRRSNKQSGLCTPR